MAKQGYSCTGKRHHSDLSIVTNSFVLSLACNYAVHKRCLSIALENEICVGPHVDEAHLKVRILYLPSLSLPSPPLSLIYSSPIVSRSSFSPLSSLFLCHSLLNPHSILIYILENETEDKTKYVKERVARRRGKAGGEGRREEREGGRREGRGGRAMKRGEERINVTNRTREHVFGATRASHSDTIRRRLPTFH